MSEPLTDEELHEGIAAFGEYLAKTDPEWVENTGFLLRMHSEMHNVRMMIKALYQSRVIYNVDVINRIAGPNEIVIGREEFHALVEYIKDCPVWNLNEEKPGAIIPLGDDDFDVPETPQPEPCQVCDGDGWIATGWDLGVYETVEDTCPECKGTGYTE